MEQAVDETSTHRSAYVAKLADEIIGLIGKLSLELVDYGYDQPN